MMHEKLMELRLMVATLEDLLLGGECRPTVICPYCYRVAAQVLEVGVAALDQRREKSSMRGHIPLHPVG